MTHSTDPYGLKVSATGAAFTCWLEGLEMSLSFDQSGILELQKAVAHDPGFALGHALLARQLLFHGRGEDGRRHLKKALTLTAEVTAREASLIDVTDACLSFKSDALARATAHLEQWPTDVFIFSFLVGPFGLLAFSGDLNWRQQNLDLLNQHQNHWAEDDWWFLATAGYTLAETGNLKQAEKAANRAWDLKANGSCAHTLSHLHIEQGALDEGAGFLAGWIPTHGVGSDMTHHMHWHATLIGFEKDELTTQSLTALYRDKMDPTVSDPMPLTTFSDNASLLWRCRLHGHRMPEQYWQDMWQYGEKHYAHTGFVFADIHKIMLAALSGSKDLFRKLETDFAGLEDSPTSRLLSCLHASFQAFADGKFSRCVDMLKPLVEQSVLLGGSNPQRNIVKETFIAASKRANGGT